MKPIVVMGVVGEPGTGGMMSAGARRPFLVVVEVEREDDPFGPKRCFAFGAEATRRMNRDAAEDLVFGDCGG